MATLLFLHRNWIPDQVRDYNTQLRNDIETNLIVEEQSQGLHRGFARFWHTCEPDIVIHFFDFVKFCEIWLK